MQVNCGAFVGQVAVKPLVMVVLVLLVVDCGEAGNGEAGNISCTGTRL